MNYDIQSKSDIVSGATLVVRIPAEDLDRKALYTIQADKPAFILPFRYRIIDGQIEFVYQIGAQSKLQYLAGNRYPKEYAELWSGVLCPLFECGDWFLRPYSFVLDINYLFCDKNSNTMSYVYIPSRRDCSDYYNLKEMAAEISRQITVSAADLENKVLRAIMLDFNPKAFLQMLKSCTPVCAPPACIPAAPQQCANVQKALPIPPMPQIPEQTPVKQEIVEIQEGNASQPRDIQTGESGEIFIDLFSNRKPGKKAKSGKKDNGDVRNKREKRSKKADQTAGIFGKKKDARRENPIEADTGQHMAAGAPQQPERLPFQFSAPDHAPPTEFADITQNISYGSSGPQLRLIGSVSSPPEITVSIGEGEAFSIGRFDANIGRQQSNFEFDKMTKAVSRRHAVIERCVDGYSLVDLSSSAGTYLNGQKLPPNAPCRLVPGCKFSFGNCGADYIWEL